MGADVDKRQRLSSDEPDILEEESEALIEPFNGDVSKIVAKIGSIYKRINSIRRISLLGCFVFINVKK